MCNPTHDEHSLREALERLRALIVELQSDAELEIEVTHGQHRMAGSCLHRQDRRRSKDERPHRSDERRHHPAGLERTAAAGILSTWTPVGPGEDGLMERRHAPDAVDATGRLIADCYCPRCEPLLRRWHLPNVSARNRDRGSKRGADRGFQHHRAGSHRPTTPAVKGDQEWLHPTLLA